MCTLDDKLLGEKVHNYCSSDEDNDDEDKGDGGDGSEAASAPPVAPPQDRQYNTGPKGVLSDYKHFKEMEAQKRREKMEQEKKLAKKCMTARTHIEDEEAKKSLEELDDVDEEFLEAYRRQRMNEIADTYQKAQNSKTTKLFGEFVQLTRETFLEAVDNEDPSVTVIVLITESNRRGCRQMESAFRLLPPLYPSSKFCLISAADVGTSLKFKMEALPAMLVYKGGDVIGNFIRLCDDLGEEACASDLEGFLVEHGMVSAGAAAADPAIAASRIGKNGRAEGKGRMTAKDDDSDDDDD